MMNRDKLDCGTVGRRTNRASTAWHDFVRREDGNITHLTVACSVIMLVFGGLGIDFMTAEMKRARAQSLVDRATLAGASLTQEMDPQLVVEDYFAAEGFPELLASVDAQVGANYRRVNATTAERQNTLVAHNFALDWFDIETESVAQQSAQNVEVSLALDISGSMADDNRIVNMRNAATTFVNLIIDDQFPGVSSINLIPYSEHVNIGPDLFGQLSSTNLHNYSYCLDFPDAEFSEAAFDVDLVLDQVPHFQWNDRGQQALTDTVCPQYTTDQAIWMSNNRTQLNTRIAALSPQAGTSIYLATKWAAAMLHPSMSDVVAALASDDGGNVIPDTFAGRPLDPNTSITAKHIVLMSDGQNSESSRLNEMYYDDDISELNDNIDHDGDGIIYDIGFWAENALIWAFGVFGVYDYLKYDEAIADDLTEDICDAAKSAGMIIWTVAYDQDLNSNGTQTLENCASSANHHFNASGTDITQAFQSIARGINQVRLMQ